MAEADGTRVLLFVADGSRYGVALDAVREIMPYRAATRLPGAPAHVVGLINLRGQLVTIVDLATQLGTRGKPAAGSDRAAESSIVLLGSGTRTVGVVVDQVRDVRLLVAGAVEPVQREGAGAAMVRALARFGDGVTVILDADALIAQVLQ